MGRHRYRIPPSINTPLVDKYIPEVNLKQSRQVRLQRDESIVPSRHIYRNYAAERLRQAASSARI